MKKLLQIITLVFAMATGVQAQTTLTVGDLAFTGYNSEGTVDSFSFMLLKDIGTGTEIRFTDRGFDDTTGFRVSQESELTWTSGAAMTTGQQVVLTRGASAWSASTGTVALTSGAILDMTSSGDQIFAFQGTSSAAFPTIISGLHMELLPGPTPAPTTAADWDGAGSAGASTSRSALPNSLGADGVNALAALLGGTEFDNAIYNGTVTGTASALRAAINNRANWLFDDVTPYPLPPPLAAGDTTPPTFDVAPAAASITTSGFDLSGSIDEAGTIFYVVVADAATAPTSAQVVAGQNGSGAAALASGSQAVASTPFSHTFTVSSLSAGTAYDVYVVARDDESTPNLQTSPVKVDVSTTAPAPVQVSGRCITGTIDLANAGTIDGKVFYSGTGTVLGTPGVSVNISWSSSFNRWFLDFDGQPYFENSTNSTLPPSTASSAWPATVDNTTCTTGPALVINGSGTSSAVTAPEIAVTEEPLAKP